MRSGCPFSLFLGLVLEKKTKPKKEFHYHPFRKKALLICKIICHQKTARPRILKIKTARNGVNVNNFASKK